MYLGEISLEIGYGLQDTEKMIQVLVSENLVREATDEEKIFRGGAVYSNIFCLV